MAVPHLECLQKCVHELHAQLHQHYHEFQASPVAYLHSKHDCVRGQVIEHFQNATTYEK